MMVKTSDETGLGLEKVITSLDGYGAPNFGKPKVDKGLKKNLKYLVGLPSYIEPDTIGNVVSQVGLGLKRMGIEKESMIANVDTQTPDLSTMQAFLAAESHGVPKAYIPTPIGASNGKGQSFLNLFSWIVQNGFTFEVGAVVDTDLYSIIPEWVQWLGKPIENGADFVAPVYSRHIHDGTITNNVVFPSFYGILGHDIRQPIGGEFAFSQKMMLHWLNQEWTQSRSQYGVDVAMSSEAILSGLKIAQVYLGAKIHKPSAEKLDRMFSQVVETLFEKIKSYVLAGGTNLVGSRIYRPEVHSYGAISEEPPIVEVNPTKILSNARELYKKQNGLPKQVLGDEILDKWGECLVEGRSINGNTWSNTLMSYMAAYINSNGDGGKLVESLKTFYRLASYCLATAGLCNKTGEDRIRTQATQVNVPYLLEKVIHFKNKPPVFH